MVSPEEARCDSLSMLSGPQSVTVLLSLCPGWRSGAARCMKTSTGATSKPTYRPLRAGDDVMDILNALVAFLNFVFVPGLAYGAQLALGALGVTLIYGILRFSNFAHGDTMAFGTMVDDPVHLVVPVDGHQLRPAADRPARAALRHRDHRGAACWCTDRVVYRFYRKQKAAPIDPGDRLAGRDVRHERHRPLHHRRRGPATSPTARAS